MGVKGSFPRGCWIPTPNGQTQVPAEEGVEMTGKKNSKGKDQGMLKRSWLVGDLNCGATLVRLGCYNKLPWTGRIKQ